MKVTLSLIALIAWTLPAQAGLKRWFVPTSLPAEIQILNKSAQALDVWIGHPLAVDPESNAATYEEYFSILGESKRRFSLEGNARHPWLQVKIQDENEDFLIVKLRKPSGDVVDFPLERAAIYSSPVRRGFEKFTLSNLSELPQNVSVVWKSALGIPIPAEAYPLPGKGSVEVARPANAISVEVRGELPLFPAWTTKDDFELMTAKAYPRFAKTSTARFLVANTDMKESFVIDLEDEALIAKARDQVARPGKDINTIVVALPGYGPNGSNQNLLSPNRTPWSWHVKKVLQFSFIGSEGCGGTAAVIEDLLQPWIDGEGGICFRDFRVVRELP